MDNKNKAIVVNIKKCLACKSCEIACALVHSKSKVLEEAIVELPRPQRMVTVEAVAEFAVPIQCRHCESAQCIEICPTGAIHQDSEQEPVVVNQELCIGCKLCMLICPFGVLQIDHKRRATIKCDMCMERIEEGLDPACVEACPTKALRFVSLGQSVKTQDSKASNQTKEKKIVKTGKKQVRKIVVIGGSAAGMMAAIAAAKESSDVDVTVITMDRSPYRRPAIPALIAGSITKPEDAKVFSTEFLAGYGIKLVCLAEATNIDTANNSVSFVSNGEQQKISYDSAVIATGSSPLMPKIPGLDKQGVCTFTTFEAASEIVEKARAASCAVVVGASFIALEIAEALMHKGLDVYFNVRSRILRKLLEPDISEFLIKKFEQQGLRMLTGEAISEIGGENCVEYVVHKGRKIATNLVVMGAGVKPNVALAEKCGIQLGPSGAIKVDNRMRTSVSNIYAAGDCVESLDLTTGMFVYSPVGSIGALAGKIAGQNAAEADVQTKGFLRAQADQILGMQIYSIGHSSTTAKEVSLKVQAHDLDVGQLSRLECKQVPFEKAKLLTDSKDKIVGAQLVAKKHGSQFAWQLYQAVLQGENRTEFLKNFISPRVKMAEALMNNKKPTVVVKGIGKDKSLVLKDTARQ